MTRQTFYRKLRKIAPKFRWEVKEESIRGHQNGHLYCPITAVYWEELGKFYSTPFFDQASRELGLFLEDAYAIARNADGKTFGQDTRIRKILMKSVGLQEEAKP